MTWDKFPLCVIKLLIKCIFTIVVLQFTVVHIPNQ